MILKSILIITLIMLISNLSVKVQFMYKREENNDYLEVILSILKYLKIKKQIPIINVDKKDEELGIQMDDKERDKFLDFKTIIKNKDFIFEIIKSNSGRFKSLGKDFNKSVILEHLDVNLEYGFNDQVYTGLLFGIISCAIWSIFSYITYKIRTVSHNINIIPNFNNQCFEIKFDCIFRIKIGNIIYISIQIMLIVLITLIHNIKYLGKIINLYKLFTLKSNTR